MKKLLYCLTLLILLVPLVSCGTKNPSQTNNDGTSISADNKITYTKEFTYLPSYNGVQSTKYTPANTKQPLAKAQYTIKNTQDAKVFEDYETILKKDGWTITQEVKVISFSAKKENHLVNVSIQIFGNDVILTVESK